MLSMWRPLALTLVVLVALGGAVMSSADASSPTVWRIFFPSGSSALSPQAEGTLVQTATWYRNTGFAGRLLISSHTDSNEAKSYADLSPARAEVVKKRLVDLGVPADRLVIAV